MNLGENKKFLKQEVLGENCIFSSGKQRLGVYTHIHMFLQIL